MIRKQLHIQNNRFLVDYFSADKDNVNRYGKFSFIRKFDVTNSISYDTDIYVIENKVDDVISSLVFPCSNNANMQYTNLYSNFNNSSDNVLERNINKLYNYDSNTDTFIEANIKCDKIRIYHPDEQILFSTIIHVNAIYNSVRFHFYCNNVDKLDQYIADKQFKVDNKTYVEYLEIYIPNIESLFKVNNNYVYNVTGDGDINIYRNSDNVYFCENLNIISESHLFDEKKLIDVYKTNETGETVYKNIQLPLDIIKNGDDRYIPFNTMLLPFSIEEIPPTTALRKFGVYSTYYAKDFKNTMKTIDNNYVTSPINVTFITVKEKIDNNYYIPIRLGATYTVSFAEAYRFTMQTSFGFDNGICSIINKFNYPNKENFISIYKNETLALQEAYKRYNNINETNYGNKIYAKFIDAVDFYNHMSDGYEIYYKASKETKINDEKTVTSYSYIKVNYKKITNRIKGTEFWLIDDDGNQEYQITPSLYYNFYKKACIDLTEEDFEVDDPITDNSIQVSGYILYIASDIKFEHIIYQRVAPLDFIEDASFNLNNIFNSWDNMSDIIVAKVVYIDRVVGRALSSNILVITKEWFKYLINNADNKYRISLNNMDVTYSTLDDIKDDIFTISEHTVNVKENNLKENMDLSYINFIDKINCVINKNETTNVIGTNQKNKLIYKPIFYRTYELQNVRLHNNIKQNVGINLGDYLTKVETFKLTIEGTTYIETARNDIYAIFNINTSILENTSGIYTITNENDDYISDGNWVVY